MATVEMITRLERKRYRIKTKCPRCGKKIDYKMARTQDQEYPKDKEEFLWAGNDMKFSCEKCGLKWDEKITELKGERF